MGTLPAFQRRGIGQAILDQILSWLDAHGCPVAVLDASAAGAPLYSHRGFVDDGTTGLFRRETAVVTEPPVSRAEPMRPSNLPEVLAFDGSIFGADRAAVIASFLADDPEWALLARGESGEVAGYLFAQTQRLGPWAARNGSAAEALLATAVSLPFDGPPVVLAPGANPHVASLLARYGFSLQRELRHMYFGEHPPRQDRVHIYGQASFAIG
jgi:hypothetical protein